MSAYKLALASIQAKRKSKEELFEMIDVFLAGGRITAEEYSILSDKINEMR